MQKKTIVRCEDIKELYKLVAFILSWKNNYVGVLVLINLLIRSLGWFKYVQKNCFKGETVPLFCPDETNYRYKMIKN